MKVRYIIFRIRLSLYMAAVMISIVKTLIRGFALYSNLLDFVLGIW